MGYEISGLFSLLTFVNIGGAFDQTAAFGVIFACRSEKTLIPKA
jgi:hypothetical protein